MTEIKTLQPHDPLPGGHSVVLMRRFDEDAPQRLMIEMIVSNPDKSEETARLVHADGSSMSWEEATEAAKQRAQEEGLKRIWQVDRTAGPREQEILQHGGDHSVNMERLDDSDLEDGEPGPDMRDRRIEGAPRRF
ncbi:MAG: hypothetical protein JO264_07575 [Acidisphaera sp.]|nr:hypothetical protein [Acidisphaera sp.]